MRSAAQEWFRQQDDDGGGSGGRSRAATSDGSTAGPPTAVGRSPETGLDEADRRYRRLRLTAPVVAVAANRRHLCSDQGP